MCCLLVLPYYIVKKDEYNKINDNLIVDTFRNAFQRGNSEVFQSDIPRVVKSHV